MKRAWPFSEGFASVESDSKWGFIKPDGSWQIEPKFDELEEFLNFEGVDESIAPAKLDGMWGFIKPDGSWFIKPTFDEFIDVGGDNDEVLKYAIVVYEEEEGRLKFNADKWNFTPIERRYPW